MTKEKEPRVRAKQASGLKAKKPALTPEEYWQMAFCTMFENKLNRLVFRLESDYLFDPDGVEKSLREILQEKDPGFSYDPGSRLKRIRARDVPPEILLELFRCTHAKLSLSEHLQALERERAECLESGDADGSRSAEREIAYREARLARVEQKYRKLLGHIVPAGRIARRDIGVYWQRALETRDRYFRIIGVLDGLKMGWLTSVWDWFAYRHGEYLADQNWKFEA